MEKQTKNILTKSFLQKELRKSTDALLRSDILLCLSVSVVVVPIACLFFYSFSEQEFNLFGVLSLLCGILVFAPMIFFLVAIFRGLREKKLLDRGAFHVECDYVTHMVDGELRYYGRRARAVKVLYFAQHEKREVDGTTFAYTSVGDKFYMVVFDDQKSVVKTIYPRKLYEWKEE